MCFSNINDILSWFTDMTYSTLSLWYNGSVSEYIRKGLRSQSGQTEDFSLN